MNSLAHFRFHGSLNDFLSPTLRNTWVSYSFSENDKPAVKDAIEALGVPHPELQAILSGRRAVDFTYGLKPREKLEVYPAENLPALPESPLPANSVNGGEAKFILDVHLGKLARSLRMLGFDALYENQLDDPEIAAIAAKEQRIVLTRDVGLLKHKIIRRGYWLRSQDPDEQLKEVVRYFKLEKKFSPFSRCLACNGIIEKVPKEEVLEQLPPKTRQHFHEFYQCQSCQRVYWKGSHYERMQEFVADLLTQNIP